MALIDSKQLNPRFTGSFILSGSTQTFIGSSDFQGSVTSSGDLSVSQYIRHKGDPHTLINFTEDRIRLKAGDIGFLDLEKDASAPYPATINPGGNRINFRVVDRNTDLLLKTDSEAFNVILYHAGDEKLSTQVGGITVTGHITASGDISSSGTIFADKFQSAGSNNEISFEDDLFVTGNISGSVTSTGSFGKIVVDDDIDLVEDQRIHFEEDRGTYIESHASDTFRVVVNDRQMFLLDEDTGNRAVFGNGTKVFIGANNNKIPTASLHIGGDIFLSGSNGNVTASGDFSGSFTSTGSFGLIQADGSGLSNIPKSAIVGQLGIFAQTGSAQATTNDLQVSGSLKISGSTLNVNTLLTSSTAISTNNITNGYPTSNPWGESLEGSYFNNFDNTSHVSEILRFMSGVLSHSLDVADAAPNTKTFGSIDTNENNLGSTDTVEGYVPTNYTELNKPTLNYLVTKGWASVGSEIFSGISVYHDNGSTYSVDFDSNSGGSTNISSSADSELFGLGGLTSGGATEFKVRVVATQSFSDIPSVPNPSSSNTFTTQSNLDLSVDSFTTSDGLTLAKINTSQPAVIPAAFQDGKFADVGGSSMTGSLTRKYHASETSFTSVSSSGYYNFHGLKVGIATGSGLFSFQDGADTNRFYAPVDQIESDIGTNSLADVATTHRPLTATSRSLSGAPYLLDSTFEVSTKITGLFNPLYAASSTLVDMTAGSVGVGSVSISNDTLSTSGGTIQTSGKVFQSDGTTAVNSGVPRYNDIVIITGSVSFDSGNGENINQTGFGDTTFTVATKARNKASSQSTLDTQNILYHSASTFDQPHESGSLGVYGRAQGYDGGSLTGTSEAFSGEDFRIVLDNNVLGFNGSAFNTSYALNTLGIYDLQVKPGFLVDPGGTYRYWYSSGFGNAATYKYYIRRFQTSGTKTSMTLDVGKTLVNWNSSTDGVAVGLIFKSAASGSGVNSTQSTARLYDPSPLTSNLIEAGVSADNFKNPFTDDLDLYGNTGGSLSSTQYTIPIRNADGIFLDDSDNELYVILRYKGDEAPVTSISLGFS
jgi:phage baseplate assembly protein gpV